MCPIYCCSFCFQIWPDFCSALKRCIKSIICTRLVRNPLLPLPNKLHYCLLGQERANLALFKAKLAVDFKSQELSYIRRRVWFLTPEEKSRAASFEVSERKIVTNFDPSTASCLQSALDRQWDLKWEVIWTVWCRVVTVWWRNLKIASALLFSSAAGNQFESSASSLVSQSDWEAVYSDTTGTNQLTTCKSMLFFWGEKSQHLLQIMFYMYCRSEHNCAFIYSSIFTLLYRHCS